MSEDFISREAVKQLLRMEMKFSLEAMVADPEVIPSADVRPNIHGHWEGDGYGHIICSACKEANVSTWKSRFCPMCGARMDGERQCERCIYHKENGCTRWVCIEAEVEPKGEKGET